MFTFNVSFCMSEEMYWSCLLFIQFVMRKNFEKKHVKDIKIFLTKKKTKSKKIPRKISKPFQGTKAEATWVYEKLLKNNCLVAYFKPLWNVVPFTWQFTWRCHCGNFPNNSKTLLHMWKWYLLIDANLINAKQMLRYWLFYKE